MITRLNENKLLLYYVFIHFLNRTWMGYIKYTVRIAVCSQVILWDYVILKFTKMTNKPTLVLLNVGFG